MANLFITALPIDGDWRTLDERVKKIVSNCDLIVGEEKKNILRLLAATDEREKPFTIINEHSTDKDRIDLVEKIKNSNTSVLVADAGTPCIADPDYRLVDLCIKAGVSIKSVPGASSITAALSVSGFFAEKFIFMGFPPQKRNDRQKFFEEIEKNKIVSIFLERPYSLKQTLVDMKSIKREVSISINLGGGSLNTTSDEINIRGKIEDVIAKIPDIKGAFVVVVDKKL